MEWEAINGITGIISAACAVIGIGYFSIHKPSEEQRTTLISVEKLMAFVIMCAGWTLCCLSFFWIVEPYGWHPTDSEYLHFYGVIIALPAFIVFMFGLNLLSPKRDS